MIKAIEECHNKVGLPLSNCVNMASLYPARALGMDLITGKLEAGYQADICGFKAEPNKRNSDISLSVKMMISQGHAMQI